MHLNDIKELAAKIYVEEMKKDGKAMEEKAIAHTKSMKFAETVYATWMAFRRLDLAKEEIMKP